MVFDTNKEVTYWQLPVYKNLIIRRRLNNVYTGISRPQYACTRPYYVLKLDIVQ